ncbi:MAG: hypothetical protein HY894_07955 [Deltaproteobacteria bacterium]|nr:hypothetical protein [Deltaproteobacteria bacterium]
MTAPSKNWTSIADSQVDADSPLDTALITAMRDDLIHIKEWLGKDYTAAQNHSHDGADSAKINTANVIKTGAVYVFDDFVHNNFIGWSVTSSGVSVIAADNGVMRATTDGTGNYFGLASASANPFRMASGVTVTLEARVRMNSPLAASTRIGIIDDNLGNIVNGIFFDLAGTTNWYSRTYASGVNTQTDTGVAVSSSWQTLKIAATQSSVKFYVNGVLKTTHTTNIPTANLGAALLFSCNSTRTFDADYVECIADARL